MNVKDLNTKLSMKVHENYEHYFIPVIGKPLAEDLVKEANPQPGQHILDVACGTGIVSRLASQRIGPNGFVAGLDPNADMLSVARSLNLETPAEWYEANAEAMPIGDNSFDIVFCQLGLQFIENKVIALKEMHRVLKPGGKLMINLPGKITDLFETFARAMAKHVNEQAAGFVKRVFSLYDKAKIKEIFIEAGFNKTDIHTKMKRMYLPPADKFIWQYIYGTPLAAALSDVDKESGKKMEHEVAEHWQTYKSNGNIVYDQPIITISARQL